MQLFTKSQAAPDGAFDAEDREMSSLRVLVPMTDTEVEALFLRLGYGASIDQSSLHGGDDR